jgi:uncharacterized membrane protein
VWTRTERGDSVSVNVTVETTINRPVSVVAAYAADPLNAPTWYRRIATAEWISEPPLRVGSQIRFRAKFLGKHLVYTYEMVEFTRDASLTMRTAEGPFPIETTYTWATDGNDGTTRMTLANRGQPVGFSRLMAPLMATAMKRAMGQDLRQLKALLES